MTREDQLEELFVFGLLRKIRPTISASQPHRLLRAGQRYSASSASGTFVPLLLLAESNTPSHIWQLFITWWFYHKAGLVGTGEGWRGAPCGQYHLDKENHREIDSKKQSTCRKKQNSTSSNLAYTDVFFEPFLLRFLLSKWYWPLVGARGGQWQPAPA